MAKLTIKNSRQAEKCEACGNGKVFGVVKAYVVPQNGAKFAGTEKVKACKACYTKVAKALGA